MGDVMLPELPVLDGWRAGETIRMDKAHEMMRDYARAAVMQERERCAKLCEAKSKEWIAC
jgi:hypothetical protein